MASASPTYASIRGALASHSYAPVYLLHGEEAFYIDQLVAIFEGILPPEERDFNMYTLYAPETSPEMVVETCSRFPMMSERQVVILKEAQSVRSDYLKRLAHYVAHPSSTTILVICSRGEAVSCKDLTDAIKASKGVNFESKKVAERNLEPVILDIVAEMKLRIEAKGLAMLRDFIGVDLARLYNEIRKMALVLGTNAMITPESIERNIGISRDYNNFELVDALAAKDAAKAFAIVKYFRANPKANPTVMTVAALYNYFSNLLIAQFSRDKSPSALMAALGLKWQSQLRGYEQGMRSYNAYMTIEIISAIRRFDAQSKGVGSRQNEYDLLHNLIFHILTAPGNIAI